MKEIFVAGSFIALKEDGGVVIWGGGYHDTGDNYGGPELTGEIKSNVVEVLPSVCGAMIILENGSHVGFGAFIQVGFQDFDIPLGTEIEKFYCGSDSAVALTTDGVIHTAGTTNSGSHDTSLISNISYNIEDLIMVRSGYVALKTDGRIIAFPQSSL